MLETLLGKPTALSGVPANYEFIQTNPTTMNGVLTTGYLDPVDQVRHVRANPTTGQGAVISGTPARDTTNTQVAAFNGNGSEFGYMSTVAANNAAYLQLTAPEAFRATGLLLASCRSGSSQAGIATFKITASQDGSVWQDIWTMSTRRKNSVLQSNNQLADVYLNQFDHTARYWRIHFLTTYDAVALSGFWILKEMCFLAPQA